MDELLAECAVWRSGCPLPHPYWHPYTDEMTVPGGEQAFAGVLGR